MRIQPVHVVVVWLAVLLTPAVGQAQTERVWVSGNLVGALPATDGFTQALIFPYRSELFTGSLAYPLQSQASFDIGAGVALRSHFGVGIAVSRLSTASAAAVAISVPDPFRFNQFASASGTTAAPLRHKETTVHIEAAYVLKTRGGTLRLFAGPSIVYATQDVITDLQYEETAASEIHSIALTGESIGRVIDTALGFNVGTDGAVFISRHFGLGAVLRFSRASASIKNVPQSTGARVEADQNVRVGGLTLGGGLRVRF